MILLLHQHWHRLAWKGQSERSRGLVCPNLSRSKVELGTISRSSRPAPGARFESPLMIKPAQARALSSLDGEGHCTLRLRLPHTVSLRCMQASWSLRKVLHQQHSARPTGSRMDQANGKRTELETRREEKN